MVKKTSCAAAAAAGAVYASDCFRYCLQFSDHIGAVSSTPSTEQPLPGGRPPDESVSPWIRRDEERVTRHVTRDTWPCPACRPRLPPRSGPGRITMTASAAAASRRPTPRCSPRPRGSPWTRRWAVIGWRCGHVTIGSHLIGPWTHRTSGSGGGARGRRGGGSSRWRSGPPPSSSSSSFWASCEWHQEL